jgi:hypothetical protein
MTGAPPDDAPHETTAMAIAQTSATLAPDLALPRPAAALAEGRRRALRWILAAPAGLALLLAGGALLVRVAVMTAAGHGAAQHTWLFTAATCVLAGLALVVVALPRLAPADERAGADDPEPSLPRG